MLFVSAMVSSDKTVQFVVGLAALLVLGACSANISGPLPAASVDEMSRHRQLALAAGVLETPRYIRFKELRQNDFLLPTITPTLQKGIVGRPLRLRKDKTYLYSVDARGVLLVGEKDARPDYPYCGHPNLTGGRAARMSGEIWYDAEIKALLINNDSGRYGFQSSRRPAQLSAVVEMMKLIGYLLADGSRPRLVERWIQIKRKYNSPAAAKAWPNLRGAPSSFDIVGWKRAFKRAAGLSSHTALLGQPPGVERLYSALSVVPQSD